MGLRDQVTTPINWDDWTDAKPVPRFERDGIADLLLRDGLRGQKFTYILGGDAMVFVVEGEDSYGNPVLEVFDTKLLRRAEVAK